MSTTSKRASSGGSIINFTKEVYNSVTLKVYCASLFDLASQTVSVAETEGALKVFYSHVNFFSCVKSIINFQKFFFLAEKQPEQ